MPPALPTPYDTPPLAEALRPSAATLNLVNSQVDALLTASPSYHALAPGDRQKLRANLVRIAAYSAELIRDDWYQSRRLGQTPLLRRREVIEGPVDKPAVAAAQAAGDDLRPAAANQIGRITRETLNAVAFPTFVADLIHSTFNAITQSSIQQIEAYTRLLDNVTKRSSSTKTTACRMRRRTPGWRKCIPTTCGWTAAAPSRSLARTNARSRISIAI